MKTTGLLFLQLIWVASCAAHRTVMVFGVFDLLHPGHISFLTQARAQGDTLIAVVTRDTVGVQLKKRSPCHNQRERLKAVSSLPYVSKVVLGDIKLGTYKVLKKYKPSIICLGYDQQSFGDHLRRSMEAGIIPVSEIRYMKSFMPDTYHTSLLRKSLSC